MGTAFTDYIPEARDSLDAAWEYIQDYKMRLSRFIESSPCGIVTEKELHGATQTIRHRFVVYRQVPAGLRRPVTACLNELRPALDHLVYGLAQMTGASESCDIAFPVCVAETPSTDKRTFDGWERNYHSILSKFPTGAIDFIRSLQPFNPDDRGQIGTSHLLHILNKLAVQYKHKAVLHVTGIHNSNIYIGHIHAVGPTRIAPGQPIEHNSVIMETVVPTSEPEPAYDVEVATYVGFDKNSPAPSAPVHEFLIHVYTFIRDEVIPKFEPFFPK